MGTNKAMKWWEGRGAGPYCTVLQVLQQSTVLQILQQCTSCHSCQNQNNLKKRKKKAKIDTDENQIFCQLKLF